MSIRRLAEETLQPEAFAFTPENAAWAQERIALYPQGRQQSAVIPLLMRAQEQEGWVSRAAIEAIADMLGMPKIRVLEVATFYTQFQLQPVGTKAHIQVCGTTPCMLRGAEDLRAVCQKKIHAEAHHLSEDGSLSWEEVECLGACVNAPMIAIGSNTYEDLTPERLEEIIEAYAAGNGDEVPSGPQIDRKFSAPVTGQVTLTKVPAGNGSGEAAQKSKKAAVPAQAGGGVKRDNAQEAIKSPKTAEGAENVESKGAPPTPIFSAPEGEKDDLKLISGVGPVLEGKLNAMGVTQFAQVALFTKDDIERLDSALNFRGRIERDAWVKQAKALADGGPAEYERVFGKKPR